MAAQRDACNAQGSRACIGEGNRLWGAGPASRSARDQHVTKVQLRRREAHHSGAGLARCSRANPSEQTQNSQYHYRQLGE